jgi:membrane protein
MLSGVIPGGGMEIIQEQVHRIASKGGGALGLGAVIGLATSLWSANQAMKAIVDSLNIVYEEKETRGFFMRLLVTMAFTLGGILFILLALAAVVVVPVALGLVGLGSTVETLISLARWPLMLLAVGFFLALIYRYGPNRERAKWRWVSWGSAFAAVAWVLGSIAFSWYVTNFGNYNETYGSLGAVIGFMTWIWISSIVVLVGAELDAEMEHQTARDTTTGPERPMGTRGARMADTVAS